MRTIIRYLILSSIALLPVACFHKEVEEPVLWEQYTRTNSDESMVNSIAVDSKNNKWFATFGGLLKYDNYIWTVFNKASGAPCDTLIDIAVDSKGIVYCITSRRSVARFDGNQWSTISDIKFRPNDLEGINGPTALCTDLNDKLWVAASYGVYRFDSTKWTTFYAPSFSYSNLWAMGMIADNENHLWIITEEKGLVHFDGTKWTTYYANERIPKLVFNCLNIDKPDNVWIGGQASGAWKFNGSGFEQFKKDTVPSNSNSINAIGFDKNENCWFATENGVLKYDGKNWTSFLNTKNNDYCQVKALVVDHNNDIWAGTWGGVYKIFNHDTKNR